MTILINFFPILLFVTIFFGSRIYFSAQEVDNVFYQIPPTSAILPSLIVAWLMDKGNTKEKMHRFLVDARRHDIITMKNEV